MRNPILWRICCGIFLLLSAVTFTPLVIPSGTETPYLIGMPRTLWAGISISISLLIVIMVAAWASGTPRRGDAS